MMTFDIGTLCTDLYRECVKSFTAYIRNSQPINQSSRPQPPFSFSSSSSHAAISQEIGTNDTHHTYDTIAGLRWYDTMIGLIVSRAKFWNVGLVDFRSYQHRCPGNLLDDDSRRNEFTHRRMNQLPRSQTRDFHLNSARICCVKSRFLLRKEQGTKSGSWRRLCQDPGARWRASRGSFGCSWRTGSKIRRVGLNEIEWYRKIRSNETCENIKKSESIPSHHLRRQWRRKEQKWFFTH